MPSVRRALVSVSDKKGLLEFARGLAAFKIEILSTGGTARHLKENGVPVVDVSDYTGQPEILDGRLKTLHPKIHGGLLAIRSNPKHQKELVESKIEPIDMVVVNLYPFEQTVAKPDVDLEEAIENIDIGGPTMVRSAAKNWQDVTVLVDPADYPMVLEELRQGKGTISGKTNFALAKKVFIMTARYDGAIASYLTGGMERRFPDAFHFQGIKVQDLRYGENPHQKAAFYRDSNGAAGVSIARAKQLHGKELSFNNILDLEGALGLVSEFGSPACVIIKHTNPCGVATAVGAGSPRPGAMTAPLQDIFIAARACDPVSAFGGIIGFNRPVDRGTAEEIAKDFYECVVAPKFDPEAIGILEAKKNIRLMETGEGGGVLTGPSYDLKRVAGGLLVQEKDLSREAMGDAKVVSKRSPTDLELQTLGFAWTVCKHVKSNAIVFAGGEGRVLRTVGIGCGQMSRIDSTKIAISKAQRSLQGAVMASDAFFPFRDCIDEAAKAGVTAVVQPGGSLRDQESTDAANEHNIAMVVTGVRHFKH